MLHHDALVAAHPGSGTLRSERHRATGGRRLVANFTTPERAAALAALGFWPRRDNRAEIGEWVADFGEGDALRAALAALAASDQRWMVADGDLDLRCALLAVPVAGSPQPARLARNREMERKLALLCDWICGALDAAARREGAADDPRA